MSAVGAISNRKFPSFDLILINCQQAISPAPRTRTCIAAYHGRVKEESEHRKCRTRVMFSTVRGLIK